jgi:methylthioribose-1-phosphate isomerase
MVALLRYADMLGYDRDRSVARALDCRNSQDEAVYLEFDSAEGAANAISAGVVLPMVAPYLAVYELALVAHAWAQRPSEARRAAIIQAAERLRYAAPANYRLARMVEAALARADAAILAGGDAEETLLTFASEEIARADRAAERCGRIAAGLLDEQDRLLVHGFPGPALGWMLAAALQERKQPELFITLGAYEQPIMLATRLAAELGLPAQVLDERATNERLAGEGFGVFVVGAERLALDGTVLAGDRATALVTLLRDHGLPRYVLAPDGPDASARNGDWLADTGDTYAIIAPELISAIITSRGIYRPEMIARYLGDGEAPLDVIPLSLI